MNTANNPPVFDKLAVLERLLALAEKDQKTLGRLGEDVGVAARSLNEQARNLRGEVFNLVDKQFDDFAKRLASELTSKLEETYGAAERARIAYERAIDAVEVKTKDYLLRSVFAMFGTGVLAIVALWVFLYLYVPSFTEVADRRAQLDQMQEEKDWLQQWGGSAVIKKCYGLPCVKVNPNQSITTNDGSVYYVIADKGH